MLGAQKPRIESVPDGVVHPDGEAAVELVEAAGLHLDPWQRHVLERSLLQRDGKWAALEVGVCCPRQNGKNALIEARELAGLFILGERLIIHSAHLADTSKEAFRRLESLIDQNAWLSREVKHIWRTNGHEAIELKGGQRVRFRTRTKGGGRGFSGDCVIFDEAMEFPEASLAAIFPIVSARENPQLWFTGSAVDQVMHEHGLVFARVRERGVKGGDPNLAYFEWSVDAPNPEVLEEAVAADEAAWAQANPALGIRISADYVAKERGSALSARSFAVERLGVGDWPRTDGLGDIVIDPALWDALVDDESVMRDPVCIAFDVSPDRRYSTIGAAGLRPDGLPHVEVIDRQKGTGWVIQRLKELIAKHQPQAVICDGVGPGASLLQELEEAGVEMVTLTAQEHAQGCGLLFDAVDQGRLKHRDDPVLRAAVRSAEKRPLGDAWAWSRKSKSADISPLVACTLALWGILGEKRKMAPTVIDLSTV